MSVKDLTPLRMRRDEWLTKYRSEIRTCVNWDALARQSFTIETFIWTPGPDGNRLFFPVWERHAADEVEYGDLGKCNYMLRIPAVHYSGPQYVVLDGVHRLRMFRPSHVIVDAIQCGDPTPFVDLLIRR
jgi:hypothetical protein